MPTCLIFLWYLLTVIFLFDVEKSSDYAKDADVTKLCGSAPYRILSDALVVYTGAFRQVYIPGKCE